MGKPFSQELELLRNTFSWALDQDVEILRNLKKDINSPVLVVGSGGSLSACYVATYLLQQLGIIAKAITPLELYSSKGIIHRSRILFISASGKNNDILFSFKTAIDENPISIVTVCMRGRTPLATLAQKYSIANSLEYEIPAGKDGFLATNSLVAYFTLMLKAFHNESIELENENLKDLKEIKTFSDGLDINSTISVLFSGWGHPAAIDIESKFNEAALGNVNISDYRNFAHGRHHWFAKRAGNSSVVALVTPEEEQLALKTLGLIPASVPKLVISSKSKSPVASLELLIKSFRLVEYVGHVRRIDPGKPGVPPFGRKLYNLRYASLIQSAKKNTTDNSVSNAILKKSKVSKIESLSQEQFSYWQSAYQTFANRLSRANFGALVFDYDGTLCRGAEDRFKPLPKDIRDPLNSFLKGGFVIGIITGRGQSARKEMQAAINKNFWDNVIIGYYNGSDIGLLSDDDLPNKGAKVDGELNRLYNALLAYDFPIKIKTELRPKQLTIEIENLLDWQKIRPSILQVIMKLDPKGIQVLESSHSMDIIKRPEVSKLNILSHCITKTKALKLSTNCLCIGDRGQWPGNDFELLSTPYSLSVDEVSSDKDSCWNLSPPGINGVDSTKLYLEGVKLFKNHFKFKV